MTQPKIMTQEEFDRVLKTLSYNPQSITYHSNGRDLVCKILRLHWNMFNKGQITISQWCQIFQKITCPETANIDWLLNSY